MNCVYLKSDTAVDIAKDGRQIYGCHLHNKCTMIGENYPVASCEKCRDKLEYGTRKFHNKFKDYLFVTDRNGKQNHSLRDMLAGGAAFLVCGGPSARELSLSTLNRRGFWSMAVNNMGGFCDFKPSAFICADPPSKFHNGIWLDPSIMKFIPTPKMRKSRGQIREKVGDEFKPLNKAACDCPNIWGFGRRAWLVPDETFFLDSEASWGNHNAGVAKTGERKTACTMLLAIRLLYYLGCRTLFLVGVDFGMTYGVGLENNYAFGENRDNNAIKSNNEQYSIVNDWLCRIAKKEVFKRFGMEVYNCNEMSCLDAFPYMSFDEAVNKAAENFPEEPFDLVNWYKKG